MTLDKNQLNCKSSFCLGSLLTTRSRRYDDYKDGLSEIPFLSLCTQTRSHEVQTAWLALSQTVIRKKCYSHAAHIRTRQQKTSGRNDEKMVARHTHPPPHPPATEPARRRTRRSRRRSLRPPPPPPNPLHPRETPSAPAAAPPFRPCRRTRPPHPTATPARHTRPPRWQVVPASGNRARQNRRDNRVHNPFWSPRCSYRSTNGRGMIFLPSIAPRKSPYLEVSRRS